MAGLGAGLQVAVDAIADPEHVSAIIAGLAVAVPTAVYAISIAVLHRRGRPWREMASLAVAAVIALAIGAAAEVVGVPIAVLGIGALMAGVVRWHIFSTAPATDDAGLELAGEEAAGVETSS